MDTYGQFCPVAQAAEIVTQRWTPLVMRELLCGSHRFNDLHRGVPKMSRTLLARRLCELEAAGLVERRIVGDDAHPEYHLTGAGEALRPLIVELGSWGKRWVQHQVSREDLDAGLLMWDIHRRLLRDRLPTRPIVIHFYFTAPAAAQQHYWLVVEKGEVSLCLQDPGREEDLYVRSDVRTLTEVWLGDQGLREAMRANLLWLGGDPVLRSSFADWLGLSAFAGIARQTPAQRRKAPVLAGGAVGA